MSAEATLLNCGNRAIDKLEETIDLATEDADARKRLLRGATPLDKQVLSKLYGNVVITGLMVSALAVYPFYRLSGRTRPILSVIAGSFTGVLAGLSTGINGLRSGITDILSQPTASSLADSIFCPVLDEFAPCERDERCRALLAAGKGSAVLEWSSLCRRRVSKRNKIFVDYCRDL